MKQVLIIATCLGLTGCLSGQLSDETVSDYQPIITHHTAPNQVEVTSYSVRNNVMRTGLSPFKPIVPTYDGRDHLLASWTPNPSGVKGHVTFVIFHGGFGVTTTDFAQADRLHKELGANVLILDSFWSRGQSENWATTTKFGVNMRVYDAIAAGKWLRDVQGTDPSTTFMMGGSQGGWTVLRSFTDEPFIKSNIAPLYKGGVSLYPVCYSDGTPYKPTLGPYFAPVYIFTGAKDEATPYTGCSRRIFTEAAHWENYPNGTHAFDAANRGAPDDRSVDGECAVAKNPFWNFAVCRNTAYTNDMYSKIKDFVNGLK